MNDGAVTERVDEDFDGTHECAHCGFEAEVRVRARANSRARAQLDDDAHELARTAATQTAGALATRTLLFVRGPNCARMPRGAAMYHLQIVLAALGIAVAGFAMMGSRRVASRGAAPRRAACSPRRAVSGSAPSAPAST